MSEPKFCYRHPTRIAKRKCFQCARPLCPDCQQKLDHHLFCSDLCHRDYLNATSVSKPRPVLRYALYGSLFLSFLGLIYFGLLADAFYSGGDRTANRSTARITPSLPVEPADKSPQDAVTITRPINGMKSASQTVEVEGKAPANAVVAVYLNGSLIESTVARGGIYNFSGVLLTKHANVLQTRYYGDNSTSNFSPAIMVLYQEPIQENNGSEWKFFQNSADNISRGNLNRKELVLTFDGGSDENSADSILKTLKQFGIHSTVFLTGEFIEKYPDMTRRIAQDHEVGNHTYSHEHLTTFASNSAQKTAIDITREELHTQLRKTEQLFYNATGKRMAPLWRAPFGEHNIEIRKWAAELGYTHVAWTSNPKNRQNLDSLDWVPNQSYPGYFPALLIKDRILTFGQNESEQANGGIILMHLGTDRADNDRVDQWLPEIIKTFRSRGYTFITASELVDHLDLLPTTMAEKK